MEWKYTKRNIIFKIFPLCLSLPLNLSSAIYSISLSSHTKTLTDTDKQAIFLSITHTHTLLSLKALKMTTVWREKDEIKVNASKNVSCLIQHRIKKKLKKSKQCFRCVPMSLQLMFRHTIFFWVFITIQKWLYNFSSEQPENKRKRERYKRRWKGEESYWKEEGEGGQFIDYSI